MQKNRRAQRKSGIDSLTIGFNIYHVSSKRSMDPSQQLYLKYLNRWIIRMRHQNLWTMHFSSITLLLLVHYVLPVFEKSAVVSSFHRVFTPSYRPLSNPMKRENSFCEFSPKKRLIWSIRVLCVLDDIFSYNVFHSFP